MPSSRRSLLAATLVAGLIPFATGTATIAADPSVTLRLATPEGEGRPSEAFLQAFASAVSAADPSMAVQIEYTTGGSGPGKEAVAAEHVLAGDVELAVIPVRAWNDVGVTSLQAFAAPLLIDDDALAVAATADPLIQPMLDAMADHGLIGLAVWPEDLRHPFTFDRNGPPLLAPGDFQGATIGILGNELQGEIITALGAQVIDVEAEDFDARVADGTVRGAESGLWAGAYGLDFLPIATADVTLYPKVQVLAMEDSAWSRLSAEQQGVVRAAAASARTAYLAQRPDDLANGIAYCEAGGRIVHAQPSNREALLAAVAPVYDRMKTDPVTATAIEAITALKATITPTGPAAICLPAVDPSATIAPVVAGAPTTLLPDGTYVHEVTPEELAAGGVCRIEMCFGNTGTWKLIVNGTSGSWQLLQPDGGRASCPVRFALQQDRVRMVELSPCGENWYDFRWRLDGDQLLLEFIDAQYDNQKILNDDAVVFRGPWTRIE